MQRARGTAAGTAERGHGGTRRAAAWGEAIRRGAMRGGSAKRCGRRGAGCGDARCGDARCGDAGPGLTRRRDGKRQRGEVYIGAVMVMRRCQRGPSGLEPGATTEDPAGCGGAMIRYAAVWGYTSQRHARAKFNTHGSDAARGRKRRRQAEATARLAGRKRRGTRAEAAPRGMRWGADLLTARPRGRLARRRPSVDRSSVSRTLPD